MLEIAGVSAGYDGRAVISDIDPQVGAGEIVALIGANGAGKSTLARTLSGLLPALSGRIRFQGQDITGASPAARVRAGLIHVPEGRQVFAGLSVGDNIALGSYLSRPDAARTAAATSLFPALSGRMSAPAGNLSGGQQQMLAIARGLMAAPKLLILDEPSLGLAPNLVAEIFRSVAALRAQGIAILLSEQNARMSLRVADRGVVIENGRIVMSGPAAELLHSPEVASRYLGLEGGAGAGRMGGTFRERFAAELRRTVPGQSLEAGKRRGSAPDPARGPSPLRPP